MENRTKKEVGNFEAENFTGFYKRDIGVLDELRRISTMRTISKIKR